VSESEHIRFILQRVFQQLEKQWREQENEENSKEFIVEADRT
jgi:hypothetical protein